MEFRAFPYKFHCAIYQRSAFVSVHRYSSHPSEQVSQREEEPFLLHEEAGFSPYGTYEQFTYDKVPIRGVGSRTDYAFVIVWDIDLSFPSQQFEIYKAKFRSDFAPPFSVKTSLNENDNTGYCPIYCLQKSDSL